MNNKNLERTHELTTTLNAALNEIVFASDGKPKYEHAEVVTAVLTMLSNLVCVTCAGDLWKLRNTADMVKSYIIDMGAGNEEEFIKLRERTFGGPDDSK